MTEEKQQAMLGEACGWVYCDGRNHPNKEEIYIPDYLNDLNAMQTTDTKKTKIKKRILTGVHIECEPPTSVTRYCGSIEREAEALERWAAEVNDFLRDHRSMEPMRIAIVRDYSDLCSSCDREWEPLVENGKTCCASCGCELD